MNISNTLVESQPMVMEVHGEFLPRCQLPAASTFCFFLWLISDRSVGLPTFLRQPEDRNVSRGAPFTLTCEAVGPPDPVGIRWLRDGVPDVVLQNSSSSYLVSGETSAALSQKERTQFVLTMIRLVIVIFVLHSCCHVPNEMVKSTGASPKNENIVEYHHFFFFILTVKKLSYHIFRIITGKLKYLSLFFPFNLDDYS